MSLVVVLGTLLLAAVAHAETGNPPGDATVLRRFALVASSNNGGANRAQLRFANSDGESVAQVLASLGGVREGDLLLARNATRADLVQAFSDLRARLRGEQRPQVRREVFVYFSGHSDEEGLLLGTERVSYRELRKWIDGVGADVRIAVLDSCASGALIRLKGGVHRAPFLSDVSVQARGHAFLTASSADEAAQESDRVGAAYFTHFLLSGLRGAADANRDRRVTLNEAYQFAYHETLQRTETSRAGAQHAAYDIQLAGSGDVVMTDLRSAGARLVLVRELAGRIYVRDSNDRLVVELRKEPTYPVELGLEAGRYQVVLDRDGTISKGTIELPSNGHVEVAAADLAPIAPLVSVRRGDEPVALAAAAPAATAPAPGGHYRHVGFDLVLAPGFRMSGESTQPVEHAFMLGLLGHSDRVRGAQISLAGNIAKDGVAGAQLGGAVSLSYGKVRGVQIAGCNLAMGGLKGAQLGYFASVAKGPVHGAQVSMVNVVKGEMRGAQVGLVNLDRGRLAGGQVGLVNVLQPEHDTGGSQVGLTNVVTGDSVRQGASIGLVNVGRKQRGAQIGLVNVADEVDGVQIGVISYARKNRGASISLLPIVLEGENHLTLDWSSASAANVGFKLGTRWIYAAASVGLTRDLDPNGDRYFSSSWGLGVHALPRGGRVFLDIDVRTMDYRTLHRNGAAHHQVNSLRVCVGYALARHLAIVAGPSLNLLTAWDDTDRVPRGVSFAEKTWRSGDATYRMYPGFLAGLEF